MELLRELNSNSTLMLDFDEETQEWGMDDIAAYAQSRAQRDVAAPRGSGAVTLGTDSSKRSKRSSGVVGGTALGIAATDGQGSTIVLEERYAKRNPEVVQALKAQGKVVRLKGPGGRLSNDDDNDDVEDDGDGEFDEFAPSAAGMDLDLGLGGSSSASGKKASAAGLSSRELQRRRTSTAINASTSTSSTSSAGRMPAGRGRRPTARGGARGRFDDEDEGYNSYDDDDEEGNASKAYDDGLDPDDPDRGLLEDYAKEQAEKEAAARRAAAAASQAAARAQRGGVATSSSTSSGYASSSSSARAGGRRASSGGGAGSEDWYAELEAAGFTVRSSGKGGSGEIYLERKATTSSSSSSSSSSPAAPAAAAAATSASRRTTATGAALTAAHAAALKQAATGTATAAGATAGSAAAGSSSAAAAGALVVPDLPAAEQRPSIIPSLAQLRTPQQVVDFLELMYPQWAANNFRLVDMGRAAQVASTPCPAEAAQWLKALALAVRANKLGVWGAMDLAQGQHATGLVECLRVSAPRLVAPTHGPELSAALYRAAQRYWLEDVSDRIEDPQEQRAPAAGAGNSGSATALAPQPSGVSQPQSSSASSSAAAQPSQSQQPGEDLQYKKLVAKYKKLVPYVTGAAAKQKQEQQQQQQQAALSSAAAAASSSSSPAATPAATPTSALHAAPTSQPAINGVPINGILPPHMVATSSSSGSGSSSSGHLDHSDVSASREQHRQASTADATASTQPPASSSPSGAEGREGDDNAPVSSFDTYTAATAPEGISSAAPGASSSLLVPGTLLGRSGSSNVAPPGSLDSLASVSEDAQAPAAGAAAASITSAEHDATVAGAGAAGVVPAAATTSTVPQASPAPAAAAASAVTTASQGHLPSTNQQQLATATPAPPATSSSSNSRSSSASSSSGASSSRGSSVASDPEQARFEARQRVKAEAFVAALWSMSLLGGPAYFEAEMDALLKIARFSSWRLAGPAASQMMWALGNARHWTPRIGDIEQCLLKSGGLSSMSPSDASHVMWGFAVLGHTPERLLYTIKPNWAWACSSGRGKVQRGDVTGLKPRQLAALIWSLAVMGQVDSLPFRSAWDHLLKVTDKVGSDEAVMTQIWQAHLAVKLESSWYDSALPASGPEADQARALLARSQAVFLESTSALRRKVQSGYQRQMANCLTAMRQMHLLEDNSSGYSVDITLPQLRIAIEADGPTHTARNAGERMLGATAMKRRHLQRLGWQVINISFKEWDKLSGDAAKRDYLQAHINAAVAAQVNMDALAQLK